jgi:hypothetical protein
MDLGCGSTVIFGKGEVSATESTEENRRLLNGGVLLIDRNVKRRVDGKSRKE